MSSSTEFSISFAQSLAASQGSYKLLELPQELLNEIEEGGDTQITLRGRTADEAVLCTHGRTYALRAVTLSNSFLVVAGATDDPSSLVVRDEVSQILELVPSLPKLQRMHALLQGCEYDDGHEEYIESADEDGPPPRKRAKITREVVREEVQASDAELAQGLRDHHVLEIDGYLLPLSRSYLTRILETLLTALVAEGHPLPPHAAPAKSLAEHLDVEHDIPRRIVMQVLPWFGTLVDEKWTMDTREVVREVGIAHLAHHKDDPGIITEFFSAWRTAVGDTFATSVDLQLLEGNYLLDPPAPSTPTHITYFPVSTLPTDATKLFTDLFLTRLRWRAVDIIPFLCRVAVDNKERDKLLMKFARATTDGDGGVWYTARATRA